MRDTILQCFQTLLPQIVKEITPLLLQHSQNIASENNDKYNKNTFSKKNNSILSSMKNNRGYEISQTDHTHINGKSNYNNNNNNNKSNYSSNNNYDKSNTYNNKEKGYNDDDYTPFSENERYKARYNNGSVIDQSELAQGLRLIGARPNFWSVLLDTREDRFYKYTRDELLSNLFREGLNEKPVYVPRTLLEKEGKGIENNEALQTKRLMYEIDALDIRCKNLKRELNAIDQKIVMEIRNLSGKKRIVCAVMSDMEEKIKKSNARIQEQWASEIDRLRKSFKEEQREKKSIVQLGAVEKTLEATQEDVDTHVQHDDDSQDSGSTISTDVVPLAALKGDDDADSAQDFEAINNEPIVKDIEIWTEEINRIRENYKSKREKFKERVTTSTSSVEDLSRMNKSRHFEVGGGGSPTKFSNFDARYGLMANTNTSTKWYDEGDYETAYMKLINKMRGNTCQTLGEGLKDSSMPFLNIKQPLRFSVLRPFRS